MQAKVTNHYKTVEEAIKRVGLNPEKTRKEPGQWVLVRNNKPVFVFLTFQTPANGYYFQVAAPLLKMPTENRGEFSEQLLRLNGQLFGVSFILKNGTIYLSTIREALDMDISEAYAMIAKVGNYTQYYSESMKNGLLNWTPYKTTGHGAVGPSA